MKYDPHCVGIRLRGARWHYVAILSTLAIVLWQLWRGRLLGLQTPAFVLAGFFVLGVVAVADHIRRADRSPDRMIVTREGIRFEFSKVPPVVLSWDNVTKAEYHWTDGTLRLMRPSGPANLMRYRELGGVRIAKRCAAEINRLVSVYRKASSVAG